MMQYPEKSAPEQFKIRKEFLEWQEIMEALSDDDQDKELLDKFILRSRPDRHRVVRQSMLRGHEGLVGVEIDKAVV